MLIVFIIWISVKLSADSAVRTDVPDVDEADAKEGATGGPDELEVAASSHTDKQLLKFKRAIRSNPNQVLFQYLSLFQ